MKKIVILCLTFITLLIANMACAATVTLNLTWTVTNTPTIPATSYRVEESVASIWGTVASVPSTQLTYQITGRAVGTMYTFRVIPVKDTLDGTPSNTIICGAVAPNTITNLTCNPTVMP